MRYEGVKALEVKKRVEKSRACGVAVVDGSEVGAENRPRVSISVQHTLERLRDKAGVDVGMVEPLGEPVAHGFFEHLVVQHGREDEAAESRLGFHGVLRLGTYLRPDRVHDLDLGCCCFGVRHVKASYCRWAYAAPRPGPPPTELA